MIYSANDFPNDQWDWEGSVERVPSVHYALVSPLKYEAYFDCASCDINKKALIIDGDLCDCVFYLSAPQGTRVFMRFTSYASGVSINKQFVIH